MTHKIFLVALGGALGALARFGLGKAMEQWNPHQSFSAGTLAANLIGCFLMGGLVVLVSQADDSQRDAIAAFLLTGFLGSLTTFSTFVLEFFKLHQADEGKLVLGFLACHLLVGVLGLWLGHSTAERFVAT